MFTPDMANETPFNKRETEAIENLFERGTVKPNYYSGTGRFSTKSADHAAFLVSALKKHGMKEGRHFITGNDAPRGGHAGEFVKILPAGRRLVKFKKFNLVEA